MQLLLPPPPVMAEATMLSSYWTAGEAILLRAGETSVPTEALEREIFYILSGDLVFSLLLFCFGFFFFLRK